MGVSFHLSLLISTSLCGSVLDSLRPLSGVVVSSRVFILLYETSLILSVKECNGEGIRVRVSHFPLWKTHPLPLTSLVSRNGTWGRGPDGSTWDSDSLAGELYLGPIFGQGRGRNRNLVPRSRGTGVRGTTDGIGLTGRVGDIGV